MGSRKETMKFTMAPELIFRVMQDQAGSLAKAVLEACMNSVDAKASKVVIVAVEDGIRIVDDGGGFGSREDIERYFATFGTAHNEGDATFGRFRIGRGQMFCYGSNEWRSGQFRMLVDLKRQGVDFIYEEGLEHEEGCSVTIELYEPLRPTQLDDLRKDVARMVRYFPIPVHFNGADVRAGMEKWDLETADGKMRFLERGMIEVYHLGAFVCEVPANRLGRGGVVLADRALRVNMARNFIDEKCPVWKRISAAFAQEATRRNLRAVSLDDAGRDSLALNLLRGGVSMEQIYTQRVITLSTGAHISFKALGDRLWSTDKLSMASLGNRLADRIMQLRQAVVLSLDNLERFGVRSPEELVELFQSLMQEYKGTSYRYSKWAQLQAVDFDALAAEFSGTTHLLSPKEYTPLEKIWISALGTANIRSMHLLPRGMTRGGGRRLPRKMQLGMADAAAAWTDGSTYIAIDRGLLRMADYRGMGLDACISMADIICHEYCHSEDDRDNHVHGEEFYRAFHDMQGYRGYFAERLLAALKEQVTKANRALRREQGRVADNISQLQAEIADLERQSAAVEQVRTKREALRNQKKHARKRLTAARRAA